MTRRPGPAFLPSRRGSATRRLTAALGAAVFLAGLAAAVLVLRASVPARDGRLRVSGLAAPATVTFDARGVPQIWALRERDSWFVLGWIHAGDRLFQMDLFRRLASGRLSELVGARALGLDARQRPLGLERAAREAGARLDPAAREALEAYCAGVNAWIRRGRLPFEYRVLRSSPRAWEIEDVAASFLLQAYDLTPVLPEDFHALLARIGEERASALLLPDSSATPTIMGETVAGALSVKVSSSPAAESRGSSSWVLAPFRTLSGGAILANDPHLDVGRLPGPLYLAGLHAEDSRLDVVGATIPGLPFFVLGHNGRVAWGATAAGSFLGAIVLVPAGADSSVYRWRGEERAFEARPETLRARGSKEVRVLRARRTHLGPVIGRDGGGSWRVLRWVGFELPVEEALAGGLALVRAGDFASFRAAVASLGCVGVSWTYADRDGHIGYQLGGRQPRYEAGAPYRVVADPDSGWSEISAFGENPHLLDPPRGWIAAANNAPARGIPGDYAFVRARRLEEALPRLGRADAPAVRALQLERLSPLAARFRAAAAEAARGAGSETTAVALAAWDGAAEAGSREAALFFTWWRRLPVEIFGDDLGADLPYVTATAVLERALADSAAPWWDDVRTPEREGRPAILARAMRGAMADAAGRPWGEIHQYEPAHPFAETAVLDRLLRLRRGPFPMAGDGSTLNVARGGGPRPPFPVRHGPVCRFVVDLSDPDGASLSASGGQSGNPLDRHYADFIPAWISGEPWIVPLRREAVEARAVETLELVPGPASGASGSDPREARR